jgi:lipid-binding SYLF domain-containing protein
MIRLALMASICSCALLVAADTPQERITDASSVFNEIMATPDKGIPRDLLEKAHCIVIVPGLKQAAFGVGGKFGRGYAICRREKAGWARRPQFAWRAAVSVSRLERRVPMSSCW